MLLSLLFAASAHVTPIVRPAPTPARGARRAGPAAAAAARRRYHWRIWNYAGSSMDQSKWISMGFHYNSSLAGCSSNSGVIKQREYFARGEYRDKWSAGKICAGACWTSVDVYIANTSTKIIHITPMSVPDKPDGSTYIRTGCNGFDLDLFWDDTWKKWTLQWHDPNAG